MRHVNARKVLPPKLLRQVQRHCSGYIYVPSTGAFYAERKRRVRELAARGLAVSRIAEAVHLTERRVRQILAE
jgi:DNA-binding NarL/FixJ family response regulator